MQKNFCFGHVTLMADWKIQHSQTLNGYSNTFIWTIFKQSIKIKLQRTHLLFSSIGEILLVTWWPKQILFSINGYFFKIITFFLNFYLLRGKLENMEPAKIAHVSGFSVWKNVQHTHRIIFSIGNAWFHLKTKSRKIV